MPSLFFIALLLLSPGPANASPQWEICLDKANFTFNVDGFLGSITATKTGCAMKFALSGGKGEKYELDLCSPVIQIIHYPTIDSDNPAKYTAGAAGCPNPLFGAGFHENSLVLQDFRNARKRVLDLFEQVKKTYGEGADRVDLENPKSFSPEVSAGRIACGQFLLKEYLMRCMVFEGKKPEPVKGPTGPSAPALQGVHPQTIIVPKK